MEMTEGFATTAAAVAPVLWAIGTVEIQQLRKRMGSWTAEQERRYNEAVVAMSEASDAESLARARGLWGLAQRWWLGPLPPIGVYAVWIYLSVTMAGCTMQALRWLSENGEPGKETGSEGQAQFIYWALGSAFLFITMLPAYVVWTDMERWRKHVKRTGKALERLNTQAQAQVQASTADPATDELPRS
ncbi:hypothetical protein [Streptomyces sp900116325]|uniref:hypothetical protein n=1 Tax=Streptomyces sp. 900116325 TaxID=3154295 RepID=UPI0033ECA5D8